MKKILFIIVLLNLNPHLYCQLTKGGERVRQAIGGYTTNEKRNFGDYLYTRRNNNCTSEYVYVIKVIFQSKVEATAYYCENELTQCNKDLEQLIQYYGSNGMRQEKIRNPNYKKTYSDDNNSRSTNNIQIQSTNYAIPQIDLPDAYSLSRLDDTGQIKGSVFNGENPREKNSVTNQIQSNDSPKDNTPVAVGNDFDKYLKDKKDDGVVAYIGNSKVPIYKDPSKLVVNTQQDIPQIPTLNDSSLLPSNANNEDKSGNIKSKINSLLSQKKALEAELADMKNPYKDDYKNKSQQLASIEGRVEWLEKVEKMSPETLIAQEKNWGKIAEMAGLAEYSYKEKEGLPPDSTWKPVKNSNLSDIIANANTNDAGFHCELLEKDGKYVVSFRGTELTDIIKDGTADVTGDIYKSTQTKMAIKATKDLIAAGIDPKAIQLTGHSLGGRLAAESAIECGLVAYTFNAADISHETRSEIGINNKGNILNIVSADDPLTTSTFGLGSSKGGINRQNQLKSLTPIATNEYYGGYTNVIKEAYTGHGITSLRQALEQRHNDIKDVLEKHQ